MMMRAHMVRIVGSIRQKTFMSQVRLIRWHPADLDGLNRQNFAMSTPAATLPSPELLPPLATTRGALAHPARVRIKPSIVRSRNGPRIRLPPVGAAPQPAFI
jgi:hypothetical protein